jgi:protease PrsW
MIDNELVTLAKQGDGLAIAKIIENSLDREKIAKYELKDSYLKLILEAEQVPDRQKLVTLINKTITSLETDSITKIMLYGQKIGESFPEWNQELQIGATQLEEKLSNVERDTLRKEISKNEFLEALQTFEFTSVFPYQQVLNPDLYRSNLVRLLLFFGLFPWAISSFASSAASLKDIAWILGIYYAFVWGIVLYNLIKPTQFSGKLTLQCVFFTAFIGIPLLIFVQQIPPFSFLYDATNSSSVVSNLIGYIFGVGILEELCKGFPIYLFLLKPGKLKEPLTPAFYGAMSGLGFAIAEGVHYSLIYATNVSIGNIGLTGHILLTTVRFISLPLIHAIWAGIVGYFLGLAAINPSRKNPIIFIGISISAVLHGVYNTFSSGVIGLIVLAFSILLFVTYLRSSKEMIREMQQFEDKYPKSIF